MFFIVTAKPNRTGVLNLFHLSITCTALEHFAYTYAINLLMFASMLYNFNITNCKAYYFYAKLRKITFSSGVNQLLGVNHRLIVVPKSW